MTATTAPDTAALLQLALAQADKLIASIPDEAAHSSTPCPDYDVTDLVDHMVLIADRVTTAAGGQPSPTNPVDGVAGRWTVTLGCLRSAMESADPSEVVTLPFGQMPLVAAYGVYVGEFTTHGWDLAAAIGRHDLLDKTLGAAALALVSARISPEHRERTPFAEVVDVAAGASIYDRLASWMGRDPARWTSA